MPTSTLKKIHGKVLYIVDIQHHYTSFTIYIAGTRKCRNPLWTLEKAETPPFFIFKQLREHVWQSIQNVIKDTTPPNIL